MAKLTYPTVLEWTHLDVDEWMSTAERAQLHEGAEAAVVVPANKLLALIKAYSNGEQPRE